MNITIELPMDDIVDNIVNEIDMDDLAGHVQDNLDIVNLAGRVAEEIDIEEMVKEHIDIDDITTNVIDNMDYDAIASTTMDNLDMDDITDRVRDLMKDDIDVNINERLLQVERGIDEMGEITDERVTKIEERLANIEIKQDTLLRRLNEIGTFVGRIALMMNDVTSI